MAIVDQNIQPNSLHAGFLLLMAFLIGCSSASTTPSEIAQGSTKDDVIALYGKPDRTQEFILPEVPFFGPQESLINLVPPGTAIEEWVYKIGNE